MVVKIEFTPLSLSWPQNVSLKKGFKKEQETEHDSASHGWPCQGTRVRYYVMTIDHSFVLQKYNM